MVFYDGPTILGVEPLQRGTATFSTAFLPVGARSIQAFYKGNGQYEASRSAPLKQMVNSLPTSSLSSNDHIASGFPNSVAVGDFNGDGIADVAISVLCQPYSSRFCLPGLFFNGVGIALGNGDGSFGLFHIYPTGPPTSVTTGDFNGDGVADVAVATTSAVSILLGNGDGTFASPVSYPAGNVQRMVAADLNGDGIVDLACVGLGNASVLLGNGDGSFAAPVRYTLDNDPTMVLVGPQIYGIAVADFNHDGHPDVAVCNGQNLSILLGNGDGTLQVPVNYLEGMQPTSLAAEDFDGDGVVDLAVGARTVSGGIYVLLGNGDGTFRTSGNLPVADHSVQPSTYAALYSVEVGDFNGDGRMDLAVLAQDTTAYNDFSSRGYISIYLGKGDGSFAVQSYYPVATGANSLGVTDLNGDGRTDIAGPVELYLGVAAANQ